ncbi:hypothetical protein ACSBO6_08605 [Bacillus sp. AL-1R]
MKLKNGFIAGLTALTIFGVSASNTFAESTNYITNKQATSLTTSDIEYLKNLGFTEDYIQQKLTQSELNLLKNERVVSQNTTEKYIKTTEVYDEKTKKNKAVDIELSKQEFEKEVKLEKEKRLQKDSSNTLNTLDGTSSNGSTITPFVTGPIFPPPDPEPTVPDPSIIVETPDDPQGNPDELPEYVIDKSEVTPPNEVVIGDGGSNTWYNYSSSYKKMKTTVKLLSSGVYHITSVMNWVIVPKYKEVDMFAVAWDDSSDYALDYNSVYGTQKYVAKNPFTGKTTSGTYTYDLTHDPNNFTVKNGSNGVMVKQNLKNNWDAYEISGYTQTLEMTVKREKSNNTSYFNVRTGYRHQTDSFRVRLDGFNLTLGGSKDGVSGELGLNYSLDTTEHYDALYKIYSQIAD